MEVARLMQVLVVNAGSDSLKITHLGSDNAILSDIKIDNWAAGDSDSVAAELQGFGTVDAVGHRVVHGGPHLRDPTRIDTTVEEHIEQLTPLAPLHEPRALAGIRAVNEALPQTPAVACFDTTYHTTLSEAACTYALPAAWRQRWELRRFGFHGLSHAYAARRAAELLGRPVNGLRAVTCHIGSGVSLCASQGGHSVDTTMGLTPLEGPVMEKRSGSVDPGLLLWLLTEGGLSATEVAEELRSASGMAGLTGGSGDMRDVLAACRSGDASAELAFDIYIRRLVQEIAAMTATLGGLDVLVLSGDVGEHVAELREAAAGRLGWLGVRMDTGHNATIYGEDADVTGSGATVPTLVVATREDIEIARHVRETLQ